MTVYDLSDVVRLRLEDISFFAVLLLLAALGIRFLWNFLARDFPRLPRLSFGRALSLTALLSLGMLLVLIMIAGARELLTPGAWSRQGSHYRPNDLGNLDLRHATGWLALFAHENDEDLEKTRAAFGSSPARRPGHRMSEDFDVIFYADGDRKVAVCVIVPRQPQLLKHGKFATWRLDGTDWVRPLSALPSTVAEFDRQYPHREQ